MGTCPTGDSAGIVDFDLEFVGEPFAAGERQLRLEVIIGHRMEVLDVFPIIAQNIGLADDADRPAGLIDHRRGADPPIGQKHDSLVNRGPVPD